MGKTGKQDFTAARCSLSRFWKTLDKKCGLDSEETTLTLITGEGHPAGRRLFLPECPRFVERSVGTLTCRRDRGGGPADALSSQRDDAESLAVVVLWRKTTELHRFLITSRRKTPPHAGDLHVFCVWHATGPTVSTSVLPPHQTERDSAASEGTHNTVSHLDSSCCSVSGGSGGNRGVSPSDRC